MAEGRDQSLFFSFAKKLAHTEGELFFISQGETRDAANRFKQLQLARERDINTLCAHAFNSVYVYCIRDAMHNSRARQIN